MSRTKISGSTLRTIVLFLGWSSVTDAYYFAAVRSSPTQPQGLPFWGWQPLGEADDMGCKVGGSQQLGWLQAFGVLNQHPPPPRRPNGEAEGFIFYSDANCQLAQSDKILYIKFNPASALPQVVSFRNLAWETDVDTSISLADNKYQSYREVRTNDLDLQQILPQEIQLPTTYVYPAVPFTDEGQTSWGGELMAEAVTTLNVIPVQQGMVANPQVTIFDALLSLMSGLGQDLATQQQLLGLADERLQFPGMGVQPPNVGTQVASPSRVLDFDTINMNVRTLQNRNPNPGLAQDVGMNIEQQQGTGDTMRRINLPLYGDTDNNQPIGRTQRGRFKHPFYDNEESEPDNSRIDDEENMEFKLDNFESLRERFDAHRMMLDLMTAWSAVLEDNENIRLTAQRRFDQDPDERVRNMLRDAIKIMSNGVEWVDHVQLTTEELITAQNDYLEAMEELEEERIREAEVYQNEIDAIQRFRSEYESTFIPSQEETTRYERSITAIEQARELYEGSIARLESTYLHYSWDFQQNEHDYYNYYAKVFSYLRNLEIQLKGLQDQLGLGSQSPVIINGVQDDYTGEVYQLPTSYVEQIELIGIDGGNDLNVAQDYEERKEQSDEGEEIEFQQQAINSSPEGSGDVVNYAEGLNVNPQPSDFNFDNLNQDREDELS
ncbi:hypothetical protein TWF730_008030 [Orbilia blumenaviensis]|uniref:Uncharacterized protein n=1 Tax=Orbilia blumenaviensis TaxID=1796055 RepID=A0AAV9V9Q3_9PEZI